MSEGQTLGEILGAILAGPPDPAIVRASFGDIEAMRELANASYAAIDAPGVSRPLAYMEAITFQRLAAAQGDGDDVRTLIFLMSDFAAYWRGTEHRDLETWFEAQALDLAESLADEGDQEVADMVVAASGKIPEAVFVKVKQLRGERGNLGSAKA